MRKDKLREVTLTIGHDERGRQIQKHFYGHTLTEAKRKREEYRQQTAQGIDGADITLSQWIDRFCSVYQPKHMDYLINRLRRNLGTRQLRTIAEIDLQKELNSVAGMSASHISKYAQIIKRIFLRARTNRLIVFDPAENLIIPQGTRGTHRALEKWEISAILDTWQLYPAGRWAMLMLLCGLRRGEMIALDWGDVDLSTRTLLVHRAADVTENRPKIKDRTKTAAGMRRLPICAPLLAMLEATPPSERVGLVCRTTRGAAITESAAKRNWTTYCNIVTRRLNGERITPARDTDPAPAILFRCRMHDLRHTFATMLYDAHVDVKAAQYYLGHSDLKITLDLYTHLSAEREQNERSNLVGFLDAYLPNSAQKS